MKKFLLVFIISIIALAYSNNPANASNDKKQKQKDRVEILYFYGKQRCATCIAIEKNTRETVEAVFADEVEKGVLVFRTIDITKKENEKIADKYEVTWSSLFICKWKNGKEKYENLTEFAFKNARNAPETFKKGLETKIMENLK